MPGATKGGYSLDQLIVPAVLTTAALLTPPITNAAKKLGSKAKTAVKGAIPSSLLKRFSLKSKSKSKPKSKKGGCGGPAPVMSGGSYGEVTPSPYPFTAVGGAAKTSKPKKTSAAKKTTKAAKKKTGAKKAAKKK